MKRFIQNQFFNFLLHIQINTINLNYSRKLPRPNRANSVSRFIAKFIDTKTSTRFIGANLVGAMMMVPLLGNTQEQVIYEPTLSVQASDIVITDQFVPDIHTKPREFVLPVERMRFIGQRFHPGHYAYDINSYVGDDVYAFSAGRIHKIEDGQFGLGRYIIVDHGHDLTSVYAHLKNFAVTEGQTVNAGEKIGEVGMTGNTTGPHLHFEIYDQGVAVNPYIYLKI